MKITFISFVFFILSFQLFAQKSYDKTIVVTINDFSEACGEDPGDAIFCLTDEKGVKITDRFSCIGGSMGWEVEPKDLITENWELTAKYKGKKATLYCMQGGGGWIVSKVEFTSTLTNTNNNSNDLTQSNVNAQQQILDTLLFNCLEFKSTQPNALAEGRISFKVLSYPSNPITNYKNNKVGEFIGTFKQGKLIDTLKFVGTDSWDYKSEESYLFAYDENGIIKSLTLISKSGRRLNETVQLFSNDNLVSETIKLNGTITKKTEVVNGWVTKIEGFSGNTKIEVGKSGTDKKTSEAIYIVNTGNSYVGNTISILGLPVAKIGLQNGTQKEWFDNGQLRRSVEYKNGELNGATKEFTSTGKIKEETNYISGKKNGKYVYYYTTDGEYWKSKECTYKDDSKVEGTYKVYDKTGKITKQY